MHAGYAERATGQRAWYKRMWHLRLHDSPVLQPASLALSRSESSMPFCTAQAGAYACYCLAAQQPKILHALHFTGSQQGGKSSRSSAALAALQTQASVPVPRRASLEAHASQQLRRRATADTLRQAPKPLGWSPARDSSPAQAPASTRGRSVPLRKPQALQTADTAGAAAALRQSSGIQLPLPSGEAVWLV